MATATVNKNSVVLKRDKECKGSVRFVTDDDKAPITNVYLSRAHPGCNEAKAVIVTVETTSLAA